jgi:dihydroflavonol-4-reductase
MKTAAITGATGFVGKRLAEVLQEKGWSLRLLARSPNRHKLEALEAAGAEVIEGDIEDTSALKILCENVDAVFHVAAYMAKDSLARSMAVNVKGTDDLLEAAERGGAKVFINLSSISVYRATRVSGNVIDESTAPVLSETLNTYSYTKLLAEQSVERFCTRPDSTMSFVNIRPTNVYGKGCGPWDQSIFSFLEKFRVCFGGIELDFVFVDDLAEACVNAAERPDSWNQHYNIGHEDYRLDLFFKDYAAANRITALRVPRLVSLAAGKVIDTLGSRRQKLFSIAFAESIKYPHERARNALGYNPRNTLKKYFSTPGG